MNKPQQHLSYQLLQLQTGSCTDKCTEREGFHDVHLFQMDSPSKKLAAFRLIRTKAKSNSNNVFGHGTA